MTSAPPLPGMGPHAVHQLSTYLTSSVERIGEWMSEFGDFASHPAMNIPSAAFDTAHAELVSRLRNNYPYFHPRYIGRCSSRRTPRRSSVTSPRC